MGNFSKLDKMANLKPVVGKKSGKRKLSNRTLGDSISQKMGECTLPSQMAELAEKLGVSPKVIEGKAKIAGNLGQFVMTLSNMMRGNARLLAKAKEDGIKLTPADLATMSKNDKRKLQRGSTPRVPKNTTVSTVKKATKKVIKKATKKVIKKATPVTPTKVTKKVVKKVTKKVVKN